MSVKAAQLHNTLSSLTPVPEAIHNSHPSQYHHAHVHPGHAPSSGPVDHLHHHLDGQGHNFSVDSLMTAQQHQQMTDSREGSPNSADDGSAPSGGGGGDTNYRNSAVSAAMASWTSNCSQQYPIDDQAAGHMTDEAGHHAAAHAHNYRAWYAIPPAGSPQMSADGYHQSTTPPASTTPVTGVPAGTPSVGARESYAAAAAAAAAYRSHLFNYNQECQPAISSEVQPKY